MVILPHCSTGPRCMLRRSSIILYRQTLLYVVVHTQSLKVSLYCSLRASMALNVSFLLLSLQEAMKESCRHNCQKWQFDDKQFIV